MRSRQIRKVLIANRGEIALRIMRTCRELGIETVAVFSDADTLSPHVLHADKAFNIGPAPSARSYLNAEKILDVARHAGADAIHPGYGFLAENPGFARMVTEAGIVFIGPPAQAIEAMGDKTEARRLVNASGVPIVPGTEDPLTSEAEGRDFCAEHGFPVLLKAAAGGGGKGMRIVRESGDLGSALRSARSEAESAFGDPRVYLEKYLEHPRHIEFQILADHHGAVVHLGERECSIQRRHQKIVEESPSVVMDEKLRATMGETAVKAARACGYANAGTIEFLVDRERNFYFLEMNTRLQVEHPVTEERTGIDLVEQQIRVGSGEHLALRQERIESRGHAIECRICAEDPDNGFLPSTGKVLHLRPAQGPGVREDRGIDEGGEISVYYDSMVSKLIVWAPTRDAAIEKMKRALREYTILGVKSNIPLLLYVMEHPKFREGDFSTHFLDQHFRPGSLGSVSPGGMVAAAAVCAMLRSREAERPVSATDLPSHEERYPGSWKMQRIDLMRTRDG
ncbi:MAG: acetyl-CoA carboxylase biotin carboxylase subunit [Bacteroidota bacterium]